MTSADNSDSNLSQEYLELKQKVLDVQSSFPLNLPEPYTLDTKFW
jgi:hypothetical protein